MLYGFDEASVTVFQYIRWCPFVAGHHRRRAGNVVHKIWIGERFVGQNRHGIRSTGETVEASLLFERSHPRGQTVAVANIPHDCYHLFPSQQINSQVQTNLKSGEDGRFFLPIQVDDLQLFTTINFDDCVLLNFAIVEKALEDYSQYATIIQPF